jgi:hypothetical protein
MKIENIGIGSKGKVKISKAESDNDRCNDV